MSTCKKPLSPPRRDLVDDPNNLPAKKSNGNVRIPIDLDIVYKLAKIHCTLREIASVIGCNVETLRQRGAAEIERGYEQGKVSLRRLQWDKAEQGNTVMLIWLGKQILGQREKQPDEATQIHFNVTTNEIPVEDTLAISAARKQIRQDKIDLDE